MFKRFLRFAVCALMTSGLSAAPAHAASLLGVSWDGSVFLLDESNGQGQEIGDSGFAGVNAFARKNGDQFFGVSRDLFDAAPTLFTIDPATGAGADAVALDFGAADGSVRGLTFSSSNSLYAINNGGGRFSTTVADDLYVIDAATGKATLVGNTGFLGIQALTTSPDGKLYGWDVGSTALDGRGLILLDPTTGVASDISDAIGETDGVDIQALAFAPDGKLYGGKDALYQIDPATGATTLIGSGGYADIRGFEFNAPKSTPTAGGNDPQEPGSPNRAPTPEPGTAMLALTGILGLAGFRWRAR